MSANKKIVIVDDDVYFTQATKERLVDTGFEVVIANSVSQAKREIDAHSDADAVVLDVMLPSDGESDLETQMGYKSGLVLARWIKHNYPSLKIVGVSGVKSLDVTEWFEQQRIPLFEKGSGEFIEGLNRILDQPGVRSDSVRSFIVHGHDDQAKYELKNYLQNVLKLPEPLILHEQASLGRSIIDKFEETTRQVNLVFVLLTPDDRVVDTASSNELKRRARQNVIFEMGYFFGKLQRRKGRVLLLHKGDLELPSDISGIIYIDISNGIENAGEIIRKELSFLAERNSS